jgi:two-component system, NarL family, response regulator NreC
MANLKEKVKQKNRKKKVTIVLADDHKMVREGIRFLLESENDFSVIGEAANGLDAVKMVNKLLPDVLVTDLQMDGLNGLDVMKKVRDDCPETKTIILSMHGSDAFVKEAIRSGASGYVLKDSTYDDLVNAIREGISGGCYLSPPLDKEKFGL